MKWLLVFGLIATILNAPTTLAGDSNEDSSSSSSDSSSSSSSDSSSSSSSSESSSTNKTVKLTKITVLSSSSDYFSSNSIFEVKKVNSTYNAKAVNYCVTKDLPTDTKVSKIDNMALNNIRMKNSDNVTVSVVVQIHGSTSESGTFISVKNCSLTLSDTTSKYYKYLPHGLIEDTQSSKILKKGTYKSDDHGHFNFDKLLGQKKLTYPYYKQVFNLECNNKTVISIDERYQRIVSSTTICN